MLCVYFDSPASKATFVLMHLFTVPSYNRKKTQRCFEVPFSGIRGVNKWLILELIGL